MELVFRDGELEMDRPGTAIFFTTISLLCQTFFYGVYTIVFVFTARVMLTKGFHVKARKVLFGLTLYLFTTATAYQAISTANLIIRLKAPAGASPNLWWKPMASAVVLLNYCISDSVVVWRSWVLCKTEFKKALFIPIALLVCTWLLAVGAVAVRGILVYQDIHHLEDGPFTAVIDRIQILGGILNILTNLLATGLIGVKAWMHRKAVVHYVRTIDGEGSRAGKVLLILIDSGVIYILSSAFHLAASLVRLPSGTLGGIYAGVNVQVAGILPSLVFLLVTREQGMDKMDIGAFSSYHSGPDILSPMDFSPRPTDSSATQLNFSRLHKESGHADLEVESKNGSEVKAESEYKLEPLQLPKGTGFLDSFQASIGNLNRRFSGGAV